MKPYAVKVYNLKQTMLLSTRPQTPMNLPIVIFYNMLEGALLLSPNPRTVVQAQDTNHIGFI